MNIYYSLFVIFSAVIFFIIIVFAIRKEHYSFKLIKSGNDPNIEARLRILMRENPHSEIVVLNSSTLSETSEILKKMEYDFPEIHIISY